MKQIIAAATLACLAAGAASGKEWPYRRADQPREEQKADQACGYLGQGYTRAPGSDTCVKVGGSVRFDGVYNSSR